MRMKLQQILYRKIDFLVIKNIHFIKFHNKMNSTIISTIRNTITNYLLKNDIITFRISQDNQPDKYVKMYTTTTIHEFHCNLSQVVDCTTNIEDVFIANDTNVTSLFHVKNTSIKTFITTFKHCVGYSLHYIYGIVFNIYIIDHTCINKFIEQNRLRISNIEIELAKIYPKIEKDYKRREYVNNIIQQASL